MQEIDSPREWRSTFHSMVDILVKLCVIEPVQKCIKQILLVKETI